MMRTETWIFTARLIFALVSPGFLSGLLAPSLALSAPSTPGTVPLRWKKDYITSQGKTIGEIVPAAPTCKLSVDKTTAIAGSSIVFSIAGTARGKVKWYGKDTSKNGTITTVTDFDDGKSAPGNFTYSFAGGQEGTYERWIKIIDDSGNTLCDTENRPGNPNAKVVTVTVGLALDSVCMIKVNGSTTEAQILAGDAAVYSIESTVPGKIYWFGSETKSGATRPINGEYEGHNAPAAFEVPYGPSNLGTHFRSAEVRDDSGNVLCKTSNSVKLTVNPTPVASCWLSVEGRSEAQTTPGGALTFILKSSVEGTAYWYGNDKQDPAKVECNTSFSLPCLRDVLGHRDGMTAPGTGIYYYSSREIGVYERRVEIRNSAGTPVCTTNTVKVTVEPGVTPTVPYTPPPPSSPLCRLSGGRTVLAVGEVETLNLMGPTGTVVWYGTDIDLAGNSSNLPGIVNGFVISSVSTDFDYVTGPYSGTNASLIAGDAGLHTRYAIISGPGVYCKTESVTYVVDPPPPPAVNFCNLWSSSNSTGGIVPAGSLPTLTVANSTYPYGVVYLYGSKDGSTDVLNSNEGWLVGGTKIVSPRMSSLEVGRYTRWAQLRDEDGNTVCTTPPVSFTIVPTCNMHLTSPLPQFPHPGTPVTSGVNLWPWFKGYLSWMKTRRGSPTTTATGPLTTLSGMQYTSITPDTEGVYTIQAKVEDSAHLPLCTSNAFTFAVTSCNDCSCMLNQFFTTGDETALCLTCSESYPAACGL